MVKYTQPICRQELALKGLKNILDWCGVIFGGIFLFHQFLKLNYLHGSKFLGK